MRKLVCISNHQIDRFLKEFSRGIEISKADRYLIETDEEFLYINGKRFVFPDYAVEKNLIPKFFNDIVEKYSYLSDDLYYFDNKSLTYVKIPNTHICVDEGWHEHYKRTLKKLRGV